LLDMIRRPLRPTFDPTKAGDFLQALERARCYFDPIWAGAQIRIGRLSKV
jgi:hypothetical protein